MNYDKIEVEYWRWENEKSHIRIVGFNSFGNS